jgi:hypothetical protein
MVSKRKQWERMQFPFRIGSIESSKITDNIGGGKRFPFRIGSIESIGGAKVTDGWHVSIPYRFD